MKEGEENDKAVLFIDAANMWASQKAVGKLINFKILEKRISEILNVSIIKIYYYTAYPPEGTRTKGLNEQHGFFRMLEKQFNFIVRKKPLKRIYNREKGLWIEKGNMDVELAIDVIDTIDTYDVAIFCTGDSDFLALINYLKTHNKKSVVCSAREVISKELRANANQYLDLRNFKNNIWLNK